jgi:ParB family chromosome partitioning protein
MVRRLTEEPRPKPSPDGKPPELKALEDEFRQALGTKVNLTGGSKGGRLVIYFYSEEELQGIYDHIVRD